MTHPQQHPASNSESRKRAEKTAAADPHAWPPAAGAPVTTAIWAEVIRAAQEKAWDEGHEAGWSDLRARRILPSPQTPNPYRRQA